MQSRRSLPEAYSTIESSCSGRCAGYIRWESLKQPFLTYQEVHQRTKGRPHIFRGAPPHILFTLARSSSIFNHHQQVSKCCMSVLFIPMDQCRRLLLNKSVVLLLLIPFTIEMASRKAQISADEGRAQHEPNALVVSTTKWILVLLVIFPWKT